MTVEQPRKKPNKNVLLSQSIESSQETGHVPIGGSDIHSEVSSTQDLFIQPNKPATNSSVSSSSDSIMPYSFRLDEDVQEIAEIVTRPEIEIQAPIQIEQVQEPEIVSDEERLEIIEPEIQPAPDSDLEEIEPEIQAAPLSSSDNSSRSVYIAPTPVRKPRPAEADLPVYRHLNGG